MAETFIPTARLVGVILAGGGGTRLWPLSRTDKPKQLLPLLGDKTLLRQTYDRLRKKIPAKDIIVIVSKDFVTASRKELPGLPPANLLVEPVPRGTAAAIAWATSLAADRYSDAMVVVVPTDHWIDDADKFHADVAIAAKLVLENPRHVVFLGIPPTRPETGYGYLWRGDVVSKDVASRKTIYAVNSFIEKPNLATAEKYLLSGEYYWNSGIAIGFASHVSGLCAKHIPGYAATFSVANPTAKYARLPDVSIDRGCWEKEQRLLVVPASFRWDDIGSWQAIANLSPKDKSGNAAIDTMLVTSSDAKGNLVQGEKGTVTAIVGLSNIAVINAGDALLICPLDRTQDVRQVVMTLKAERKFAKLV